jgi:hypothetical protein
MRAGDDLAQPVVVEQLAIVFFCFEGYVACGSPVRVTITGPRGTQRTEGTSLDENVELDIHVWTWKFTADLTLGTDKFRAVQARGGPDATGTLEVKRARRPAIRQSAARAPSGEAGLQIEMAGYKPGATVDVFLYGPERADNFRSLEHYHR